MKCGKRMHRTPAQANAHMARLVASHPHSPDNKWLWIYYCQRCRRWHVGHVPRRSRRAFA